MLSFYKISKSCFRAFFHLLYDHEVIQRENSERAGAAIIAANHLSFLDPPLLSASLGDDVYFLARSSLFQNPFFKGLITGLHAYPISAKSSLKTACDILKDGKKLVIFPEGTRSQTGELCPFKKGVGILAIKAQCPIIPTYIHGTFDILPKGKKLPLLLNKKTLCIFGAPLFPNEQESAETLTEKTHQAVLTLKRTVINS